MLEMVVDMAGFGKIFVKQNGECFVEIRRHLSALHTGSGGVTENRD